MAEEIHIREFVAKILAALNDCEVEYLLVGGIAAVHYGRPRTTMDCDIILQLNEADLDRFYRGLKSHGFDLREYDLKVSYKDGGHFNAYLKGYPYRVDFSWKIGTLAEYGFARAKKTEIFGIIANLERPEDLIVAKLVYGSEQDLDDALAVFLEQKKELDLAYLERRTKDEGVKKHFDALLKKAEE